MHVLFIISNLIFFIKQISEQLLLNPRLDKKFCIFGLFEHILKFVETDSKARLADLSLIISKEPKFKYINLVFLNATSILFKFLGEKCEISKYFIPVQPWNIYPISSTFDTSKIDKFKEIKDVQWLNIAFIVVLLK